MMKKLLLLLALLCAPAFAQTAYFSDRAVGVSPFGSILGLVPVQYGQVRVCDLPLTQISPCLPLASITGVPGFPVDTSGSRFGQITTLVTGQFSFGCTAGTNLEIQVSQQSSNTPMLSYLVTCGGVGTSTVPLHNLLSLTHPDTTPAAVQTGDIIIGHGVVQPKWERLVLGPLYKSLQAGTLYPQYDAIHLDQPAAVTGILPVLNGGTGVNTMTIHGVLIGQTQNPIHITTAGNATECLTSNGAGADPTFQACPGGSNPCDISQVTDWYVDPGALTGDATGTGAVGFPWQTVQHAVDQLPGIVCGRYTIHLATPETTFVFTQVAVGATAVYSYSSFAGTTPYIGEVVKIVGFAIAGNNKTSATLTGVDLGLGTVTLVLTTQANEVHAGTGAGNHYLGGVVMDGRVFAGGNGGGTSDPGLTTWPINDANYGTLAYSWLLIVGDPTDTAPSTYVIQPAASNSPGVAVAGGNVTLQGLKILDGNFGVQAAYGSLVNLNGVWLDNQTTGMVATEGSTIHIDCCDYVDPAFTASVLITNTDIPTYGASQYGWLISDDSLLTDYVSDGNNTDTNAILGVDGPVSIACGAVQYARVWFRGTINCLTGSTVAAGLKAWHSRLSIATLTNDGQSLAGGGTGGTGLLLESSQLSGAALGGANYTFQNFNGTNGRGINLDCFSYVDSSPTFSGNTINWFTTNQAVATGCSTPGVAGWSYSTFNKRRELFDLVIPYNGTTQKGWVQDAKPGWVLDALFGVGNFVDENAVVDARFIAGGVPWEKSGVGTPVLAVVSEGLQLDTSGTTNDLTTLQLPALTTIQTTNIDSYLVTFDVVQTDANTTDRIGLADSVTDPPTNGIYLECLGADTNWFLVTRDSIAALQTRTDTGVARATGKQSWLITVNKTNSRVIAYRPGDDVAKATNSTHIPAAGTLLSPIFVVKTLANAVKQLIVYHVTVVGKQVGY